MKKFDIILGLIAIIWMGTLIFFSKQILGFTYGLKWFLAIMPALGVLIYLKIKQIKKDYNKEASANRETST